MPSKVKLELLDYAWEHLAPDWDLWGRAGLSWALVGWWIEGVGVPGRDVRGNVG